MKLQILSGVMIMGTACFPTTTVGTGKTAKKEPTIVEVEARMAKELVKSGQAKVADKDATVNCKIASLEKDTGEDALDDFFGPDDDAEE